MKRFTTGLIVGLFLATSIITFAGIQPIKLIVNGAEVFSDVPPQIIDGRTMIPARPLAEALGAKVEWDAENSAVVVTGGIQKGAMPTDLEPIKKPIEENNKGDENVENIAIDKTNGIQKYEKDGHVFLIKDGVEYYPTHWIDGVLYQKQHGLGYNLENKEAYVESCKDSGRSINNRVKISENIPYEVFEHRSYIKKEYYENTILPVIK